MVSSKSGARASMFVLCVVSLAARLSACAEPSAAGPEPQPTALAVAPADPGGGDDPGKGGPPAPLDLDPRRTLAVTDLPILERFSFERVLDQLIDSADVPGQTALSLFRQWWDTHNEGPGLALGASCDSESSALYGPSLNGFPLDCRPAPAEGAQASCTDLDDNCSYIPIGLFNRFDLAPVDGAHCGEYRIVYAKATGVDDARDRNLIIFEAAVANPVPAIGIDGCRRIVEKWAALNDIDDIEERADRLEQLYFEGFGNIPPIIDASHFGDNALGAGQIRTNEFMQGAASPRIWTLRELKLHRACTGADCRLRVDPVTVKTNPFGRLFASNSGDPRQAAFQADFLSNVPFLAADDLRDIAMSVPDTFNAAESHESGTTENDYISNFGVAPSALRSALEGALAGSSLTPDDIVARAMTQSCAGCHRLSNGADLGGGLTWPPSTGFTHVSERSTEEVGGVLRFAISPALVEAFLPVRKQVMEDYLESAPGKLMGLGSTIGGRTSH